MCFKKSYEHTTRDIVLPDRSTLHSSAVTPVKLVSLTRGNCEQIHTDVCILGNKVNKSNSLNFT